MKQENLNSFSVLQASGEFFTFNDETITVSIMGNPSVTRPIPLGKGQRQTLLIPLNLNDEWQLVSEKNKIMK